jgi:hypothetical protein
MCVARIVIRPDGAYTTALEPCFGSLTSKPSPSPRCIYRCTLMVRFMKLMSPT